MRLTILLLLTLVAWASAANCTDNGDGTETCSATWVQTITRGKQIRLGRDLANRKHRPDQPYDDEQYLSALNSGGVESTGAGESTTGAKFWDRVGELWPVVRSEILAHPEWLPNPPLSPLPGETGPELAERNILNATIPLTDE